MGGTVYPLTYQHSEDIIWLGTCRHYLCGRAGKLASEVETNIINQGMNQAN
jgi:hypothetical protein